MLNKKFFTLMLTLLMVIAMMPASVFADEVTEYDLWVGGEQVTSAASSGEGWSYEGDGSAGTLTLTDAAITGAYEGAAIYSAGIELTIALNGNNTVENETADFGIAAFGNPLTIAGTGSLSVKGKEYGIASNRKLTVNDAAVTAESTVFSAISCEGLELNNADVSASSAEHGGIDAGNDYDCVITGSKLKAAGGSVNNGKIGSNDGLWAANLIVTDSELECSASNTESSSRPDGILVLYNATITGSAVIAKSANGNGIDVGEETDHTLTIEDSVIDVKSTYGAGLASSGAIIIKNSEVKAEGNNVNWDYGTISTGAKLEVTDSVLNVKAHGTIEGIYSKGGISFQTGSGTKETYIEVDSTDAEDKIYPIDGHSCDITLSDDLGIVLPENGTIGKGGSGNNHTVIYDGESSAKHVIIANIAHKITVEEPVNGTVTVSADKVAPGKEITVTAEPDSGYELESISYTDAAGTETDITEAGSFTMPDADVTVKATFKEKPADPEPEPEPEPAPAGSAAPKIHTEGKSGGNMQITWNKVKGATSYIVAYRIAGAKKWTTKTTKSTKITLKGMKTGKLYEYQAAARKGSTTGKYSNVSHRFYRTMGTLKAKAGKKSMKITWSKVKGATGYMIEVSTTKGFSSYKTYYVKSGSKTAYTVKKLKSCKTYYVKVRPLKKSSGKNYLGILKGPLKVKVK